MDISKITDYNLLREAFIALDKSGDGHVSQEEAQEDVVKYDMDHNHSVELWEYMEAVNQETKREIFNGYEVFAGRKAYELYGSLLKYLEKKSDWSARSDLAHGKIVTTDTRLYTRDLSMPFLSFMYDCARLGIEANRIFELIYKVFKYDRVGENGIAVISSLLKIGATDEEISKCIEAANHTYFIEYLPALIGQMQALGFSKSEILAWIENKSKLFEEANYILSKDYRSGALAETFKNAAVITSLRELGFNNSEIISLIGPYRDISGIPVDIIKEALVRGMQKKDLASFAAAAKGIPDGLPQAYSLLIDSNFPKSLAIETLLDLAKNQRVKEFADNYILIYSLSDKRFKMKPPQIASFLKELSPLIDFGSIASVLISQLLFDGWDANEVIKYFKSIREITKESPDLAANYLIGLSCYLYFNHFSYSDSTKTAIQLLINEFSSILNPPSPSQMFKDYPDLMNEFALVLNPPQELMSAVSRKLIDRYLLNMFYMAINENDGKEINKVIKLIKEINNFRDPRLDILKYLDVAKKIIPTEIPHRAFSKIVRIDGLTVIIPKGEETNFVVLPGSVKIENNRIKVEYFNRKNFIAVFETPIETVIYADKLIRASEMLPQELFNSFDKKNNGKRYRCKYNA